MGIVNHKAAPHKWMQCMEEFAEEFKQIKNIKKASDPDLQPVTVALIDDGVDMTHPALEGKKFAGRSFDDDGGDVTPYTTSSIGHGTLMARLILRICPSAVIYVIKLKSTVATGPGGRLSIDSISGIKAIEHAAEIGAQIISMSWVVSPEDPAVQRAYDLAVYKAYAGGAIMFNAASDLGRFRDSVYPHASNPNFVFRIGAATATGVAADYVTADGGIDFVLPGHQVPLSGSPSEVHDGSSVATALAAGLAAIVLECVRLGIIYTAETKQNDRGVAIKKEHLVRIRSKKAMEYAFNSINVNRHMEGGNRYIDVWDTFSDVTRELRYSGGIYLDQLEVVAGLARVFLRTGVKW